MVYGLMMLWDVSMESDAMKDKTDTFLNSLRFVRSVHTFFVGVHKHSRKGGMSGMFLEMIVLS